MKHKFVLFFILLLAISSACVNKQRQKTTDREFKLNADDVAIVIPELHSISELKAIFESADIEFDLEIINQTKHISLYFGDKKIAANIGVYMADLLYVMATKKDVDIRKEYGAVIELAKQYGFADELFNAALMRYQDDATSVNQFFSALETALEQSSKNMTESEVSEFNSYLILGNYIEKLYIVSSLLQQKNDNTDSETAAKLKMKLLHLLTNQSVRINQLLYILSKYPNQSGDVVVLEDLQLLFDKYLTIEANRDRILEMEPAEIYKSDEVNTIFKQIDKIRNRMVLL